MAGYAAAAAAGPAVLNGLAKPLLPQESERTVYTAWDEASDDETVDEADAKSRMPLWTAIATAALVTGGLAASAAAMVSAGSIAVYVAGGICILNSPVVAVKQYHIHKGVGLRQTLSRMREILELLKEERKILQDTVDDLHEEVECLRDISQELDDLAVEMGTNSEEIVELVNENELVLQQMKDNLRDAALSDITKLVIASDKNGDMKINLKELEILTLRVKLTLEQRGIDLDEEQFTAMVRKDNEIGHILRVVAAIMFEEDIDDRNLAEYAREAMQESARQDDMIASMFVTGTMLGKLRRLGGKDDAEEEEGDAPMFALQEKYTQGSVAVARGSRVSFSKSASMSRSDRTMQVMRRASLAASSNPVVCREMKRRRSSHERMERRRSSLQRLANPRRDLLARERNVRNLSEKV